MPRIEGGVGGQGAALLAQINLSESPTSTSHLGLPHRPPNFTRKSNFQQQ